jgi:large subunit ribosomal protein L23
MSIIIHPLSTEKSIRMMETGNVLTFIVRDSATKNDVKKEIEKMFNVKVLRVTTNSLPDGRKKAYVKISPETPAIDIATRLGMV